jgi:hypothetical protein
MNARVFLATNLLLCSFIVRAAPQDLPLIQSSDITWLGAFSIDTLAHGGASDWFGYGGHGLTFYQDPVHGASLYMERDSSKAGGVMAQVKIPATLSTSATWSSLPQATVVQNFYDATDGNSLGNCGGNGWFMYGGLPYNNRMIWSGTCWYAYNTDQTGTHGASGFNLSVNNDFIGWKTVAPSYKKRAVSGFLASVPAEWQSLLGGGAISGNGSISIIGETSAGPSAYVFNPDDIYNGSTSHPGTRLLEYGVGSDSFDQSCPLGDCPDVYWNLTTTQAGMVFPNGYRTVLYATNQGLDNTYCYGTTTYCQGVLGGSVCNEGGVGPKSTIQKWQLLAYDANDLLAVKNGTKQYYEPKPYARFTNVFPATFGSSSCHNWMYGMTYDPSTRRIYISYDYGDQPTIQVFQLAAPATDPDTASPTTPTNLSATAVDSSQINLSWTASTDDVGVAGYDIRRCSGSGCVPSAIVHSTTGTGTTWSNTGLSSSTLYRYDVRAKDAVPNYSSYSTIAQATTQAPADTTAPTVQARSILSTGTTFRLDLNETVQAVSGAAGLTLSASGGAVTLSGCTTATDIIDCTTSRQVLGAETVMATYSGSGGILDTTGNPLGSFIGQAVSNGSGQAIVVISGLSPATGAKLAKTTTSTTLQATTNKVASCRWGATPEVSWASLNAYDTTGSTSHSEPLSVLAGDRYQICTTCLDTAAQQYTSPSCTFWSVLEKPKRNPWW